MKPRSPARPKAPSLRRLAALLPDAAAAPEEGVAETEADEGRTDPVDDPEARGAEEDDAPLPDII